MEKELADSSAPAPAAASNEGSSQESFDFGALATYDDSGESGTESGKEAVVATAEVTPPAASGTAPSASSPTPPVAAQPAVAQPPLPTPEQQVVQPPQAATGQAPATEAQVPEQVSVEQHRSKFLPQLAKLYTLTDAEVEGLQANPGAVLPEMAARLHYEVQMATFQGLMQVLPSVIESQVKLRESSTRYNDQFYGKWPALKTAVSSNPTVEQNILQAINAYRQVNPQAPVDKVIAEAGLLAMISLGIPLDIPGANGAAPPLAVPRSVPARPAGIGAQGHVQQRSATGAETGDIFGEIFDAHQRGEI